jgi:GT2 family glycosyltransferase
LPGFFTLRYTPNDSHKVSIIIPTKDKADILKKCLESIFQYTHYSNFEVLVVSNNSKENSLFDLLKEYSSKYPDRFKYFEHNILFNYSELMNYAVTKVSGDILLFLNNDTEIIHEGWLEEMLGQAERESMGAVGCKLLYPNDTVQHAGVVVGLGGAAGHLYVGEDRHALGYFCGLSSINNYSAVTGACMMCRKAVFEEVSGFDKNLSIEFNDTDFCLKLIEKGYYNVYLPQVEVYHHESLTRGYSQATTESTKVSSLEGQIFISRWKKYIEYDPFFSIHFSKKDSNFRLLSNI